MTLTPKNWSSFQHYKDRSPAWIKLHRGILDDYEFACLPVASRALAPLLWLLASECEDGKITMSVDALAFRLRMGNKEFVDALKPLIDSSFFASDSELLAPCKQAASPEIEEEKQDKKEKDIRTVAKATRPERDEKFEEFKKAYPKRKGGNPWKPAKDLWLSALKRGVEPDAIIAAVKAGTGFDRDKIGTEFIPQAVKWLRDQRFDDFEKPEEAAAVSGYYAEFGSAQLDAWDAHHRKSTGHGMPRDRKGGWRVDTEWPPGHDPPKGGAEFERGRVFSESIQ